MCEIDYDRIEEALNKLNRKQKEKAIGKLQSVVDKSMVDIEAYDDRDIRCPHCDSIEFKKNGHNSCGHQRYKCKSCGKTFVHRVGGNVLALSKLKKEQWLKYCRCFVEVKTVRKTAEECGVSLKTSMFMRRRMGEIIEKCIPSFEVKEECKIEFDEFYVPESFKGNHKKSDFKMPRTSRKNGEAVKKRGLSCDQIAVMTAITDNGDFFYEIACRGNITGDIAESIIKDKVSSGAIVSTDKHHAYVRVFRKVKVKCHIAYDSKSHKGLGHINALHGKIRGFLRRFNGVSTKWLPQYLAWFKWLESFTGTHTDRVYKALGHMVHGSYEHVRRKLKFVRTPFIDDRGIPVKCC